MDNKRLDEVLSRLHGELEKIEERRTFLKQTIGTFEYVKFGGNSGGGMSAEGREKISKAQKKRWAKESRQPNWSSAEDKVIIKMIKSKGPVEATDVSRLLLKKLTNRTVGAVRQRINRLAIKGLVKQSKAGKGVKMTVEAA